METIHLAGQQQSGWPGVYGGLYVPASVHDERRSLTRAALADGGGRRGTSEREKLAEEALTLLMQSERAMEQGIVQVPPDSPVPLIHACRLMQQYEARMRGLASVFPEDTQRIVDQAVVEVGMDELVLVQDMIQAGMTRSLPGWLGIPFIDYRQTSRAGTAHRTMDLELRGERAVPLQKMARIPIFATWEDFSFGARELAYGDRIGQPLDTTMVTNSTRNVNEAIEDQAWNGAGFNVDGVAAPGFLSSPANEYEIPVAWDDPSINGADMLRDVDIMAQTLADAKRTGPLNLYYPRGWNTALNGNFSDGTTTFDFTIRERMERQQYGGRPLRLRQADTGLGTEQLLMLEMLPRTADVIIGQYPATLSWPSGSGLMRYWLVLASIVTRIKEDYDGTQGYVVGTVAA